jgi:hypothetical protein
MQEIAERKADQTPGENRKSHGDVQRMLVTLHSSWGAKKHGPALTGPWNYKQSARDGFQLGFNLSRQR